MDYSINNLTLEEKLRLLCGADTWHLYDANGKLPQMFLSDGPNGLRMVKDGKTQNATAMPAIEAVARTWDPELARLDGSTIADDCIEKGADVLLAPGVNIKRTPLCGRNFEYFSEDPLIAGELGKTFIEGVQEKGIGTSLKHFCANNSEYDRLYQSSDLDERTMRDIYLSAFKKAVEAKPWTVMCSYNPVNGVYASENRWLLNDVLREEFGFDGTIISDWGAVINSARSAKATLDIRMAYDDRAFGELKKAYDNGYLTEDEINERAGKVLELIARNEEAKAIRKVELTKEQRHNNALKIAKEAVTLLKNEGGLLPLKDDGSKVLMIGESLYNTPMGGGGSALVQTDYPRVSLAAVMRNKIAEGRVVEGPRSYHDVAIMGRRMDMAAAADAGTVIIGVGETSFVEAEGYDREKIRLHTFTENLIKDIAAVNPNTIVVVYAGSAVDMSRWINDVKAVVLAGYLGEAANEAVASVLTGETVPCGKLTETYPLCLEDTPTGDDKGTPFCSEYKEGVFVGYRYYDKYNKEVLFPFGHGLSYAEFSYSDLTVEKKGDAEFVVSYNITNDSDIDAKEISQVYVGKRFSMVPRPIRELKGFSKDLIKAHSTVRVSVELHCDDFAYYNVSLRRRYTENGEYRIYVGASSRDIRLEGKVDVTLPFETQASQRI